MKNTDSRYPYTYAADYLREKVKNDDGSILSRSVMAQVQQVIADALGMETKLPISEALADKFIEANDRSELSPPASGASQNTPDVEAGGD